MVSRNSLAGEIAADLRSTLLLPGLSIGLIIGLMLVIIEVSFASMIFSGPLSVHLSGGIGMLLAGTFVFALAATLSSKIRSVIALPQDAPVALFAGVAAAIAAVVENPGSRETFLTIAAGLLLCTLVTGVFFYLVGRFKLADLFRFIPHPVISGFLAGTGWLLTRGSLEVMTDLSLSLATLPELFTREMLVLWLPGLAYAFSLFFILRRFSGFLILPGSLLAAVLLYYAVFWASGISLATAREIGILYQPFAETALWPAYRPGQLGAVNWSLLAKQAPALAVIPFISLVGMLLNTGGIELASKKEFDMNRELKALGTGNFLSGFFGGAPGYSALSLSMLGPRTGANSRLVGLAASLVVLLTLVFGSSILVLFPRAVLGGFLFLLGLFFIFDWLIDTAKKMPRSDHILVILIFLVISVFGYLQGVVFGLLMTMIFFVIRFSRVPLIHDQGDLSQLRSNRVRPLPQQVLLAIHGSRAQVYNLTGYIFFGSVTGLIGKITETARARESGTLEIIFLDFRAVNGYDISSVNNFIRLINRFAGQGVFFVFAAAPHGFMEMLLQNLDRELAGQVRFFAEAEKAMQWAEDHIIALAGAVINEKSAAGLSARDALFDSTSDDMLTALDRQARVEHLIDSCSSYLSEKSYGKGALILGQGSPAEGIYLIISGVVTEQVQTGEESPTLLRELGPGTLFAEPALFEDWQPACSYRAKTEVRVSVLDSSALGTLENELPRSALELYRLVIDNLLNHR